MKTPVSIVTQEDCMDLMSRYPDKYFELAIVDPPYGIGEDGRKTKSRCAGYVKQKNGTKLPMRARDYKSAGWDKKPPTQEYFNELFRVSKNQIIWGENHMDFHQKKTSSGRIVWDKVNGESDFSDCEIAWTNCIKSTRQIEYMWSGFIQGKSLKEGRTFIGNMKLIEERLHPTQKPILLYKWLLNYAKEGDKILDTHLGSGSSRIAAYIMGFDFYACEIDKDYFDAQEKRFREQTAQQSLFNYEKTA
jgi:site-specific DNA-methyltransferase (adenine-specific)